MSKTAQMPMLKMNEMWASMEWIPRPLRSLIREGQARGWCAVEDAMIAARCYLGHLEQAGMHRAPIIEAGLAPTAETYALI
ncbi:uncharacterized protein EHS24_001831 [Apiotrichum porosum]|uniref:Uncharacterized protein n=1 Tax=Apiotrichum porosum TaxID=105984 RepID=A0A427XJB6_9TREE|nr:uncharacterized protein EHS24_001831 [Apiotrichum porosum]RSH78908.1 hypothetical protein EHS24_001831 [Apiotrichum porosum]